MEQEQRRMRDHPGQDSLQPPAVVRVGIQSHHHNPSSQLCELAQATELFFLTLQKPRREHSHASTQTFPCCGRIPHWNLLWQIQVMWSLDWRPRFISFAESIWTSIITQPQENTGLPKKDHKFKLKSTPSQGWGGLASARMPSGLYTADHLFTGPGSQHRSAHKTVKALVSYVPQGLTGSLSVQPDQALLSTLLRSLNHSVTRTKDLGIHQGQSETGSLPTSAFQPCPIDSKFNLMLLVIMWR